MGEVDYDGHNATDQAIRMCEERNNPDPLMFYAVMNMMYSDYCKAAEKANASSLDLYVYMAKAFLDDKDAVPHKLARYYHYIAEK